MKKKLTKNTKNLKKKNDAHEREKPKLLRFFPMAKAALLVKKHNLVTVGWQ